MAGQRPQKVGTRIEFKMDISAVGQRVVVVVKDSEQEVFVAVAVYE